MISNYNKFLHFLVIYCYGCKNTSEVLINQESIAEFLKISRRSIIRYMKTLEAEGMITVTGKKHIYSHEKRTQWAAKMYEVDLHAVNSFLTDSTGYDVLDNIATEITLYFDFLKYVRNRYIERQIAELPEEEKKSFIQRVEKRAKVRMDKMNMLQEDNAEYLKILAEVNNPIIPMAYLNEDKKRLINALCATKNQGNSEDSQRYRLLRKFFNSDKEIVEFDTNASIYRLSYALGNKKCMSDTTDIYQMIYEKCNFTAVWTNKIRSFFKRALMPIYMREGSLKFRCMQYEKRKYNAKYLTKKEQEEIECYAGLEKYLNLPIYEILNRMRKAMHEVFNMRKFYKADIFIYESNLHIIMLKIFKDLGIKTINVYDGFYFEQDSMTQELYNKVYTQAVEKLIA